MLNIIPVVMLLLMQGAGGSDLSLRQQQTLLDLVQRVQLAQDLRETGAVSAREAGVAGQSLAYWLQVICATPSEAPLQGSALTATTAPMQRPKHARSVADPKCARPRDGPAF
ncbi:MAG TPA: hypothetical protein VNI20_00490 [Fimbriimonadaceae bacterium]|nr:hypothetical protein [Fimbriimonadaceae bacterium]